MTSRPRRSMVIGLAAIVSLAAASAHAQSPRTAAREVDDAAARKAAVVSYLRHICAIYFGIRACTEMSKSEGDSSFRPDVTLDEARQAMRAIDAATAEVGLDSKQVWDAVAPLGLVTAEAMKRDPQRNLVHCHEAASLFRTAAANLQANLRELGAKTPLIPKDY